MEHNVATSDSIEKVTVRNNSRRSLLIKVPGEALHLQPGASAEVPRAYLNTNELATLVRSGAVLLVAPPAVPTDEAKAAPSEAPAAEAQGSAAANPARRTKTP